MDVYYFFLLLFQIAEGPGFKFRTLCPLVEGSDMLGCCPVQCLVSAQHTHMRRAILIINSYSELLSHYTQTLQLSLTQPSLNPFIENTGNWQINQGRGIELISFLSCSGFASVGGP